MKLVTYLLPSGPDATERLGAVLNGKDVVDLNWGYVTYLKEALNQSGAYALAGRRIPSDMVGFLQGGEVSMSAARETLDFLSDKLQAGNMPTGPAGEKIVYDYSKLSIRAPIPRPGKIIAAGRNFSKHLAESQAGWKARGKDVPAPTTPVGFIKVSSAIVGPCDPVIYPVDSKKLDYEVEFCVVIGKKAKHVPPEQAFDYVAGYTALNDLSTRDWQDLEKLSNSSNVAGKNLDCCAPMGPWIVTKDEIKDPHNLNLKLWVNGEIRQDSNSQYMIFKVPQLIEHWSMMTLEVGDMISTGTPEGVATHRKPDPTPFFLKPGDVVEVEIEGIGRLRNQIVPG